MDTLVERARAAQASAKARQGLTEAKLREMAASEQAYQASDGGNGLYVVVSPSGSRSFRYDYRLGGRRETLTIGRHEPIARHAQRSHLWPAGPRTIPKGHAHHGRFSKGTNKRAAAGMVAQAPAANHASATAKVASSSRTRNSSHRGFS